MKRLLYFGHPVNTYNTPLELELMREIAVWSFMQHWDGIRNPNQPHHQAGYECFKKIFGNGMVYFYDVVLPQCRGGIFLPFRDGRWGADIWHEAEFLQEQGFPLFKITHDKIIAPLVLRREPPPLSVEETRRRVLTLDGEIIPY